MIQKDPYKTLRIKIAGKPKEISKAINRTMLAMFNLWWLLIAEDFKDYIRTVRPFEKAISNEMMILANGPSLKETLVRIRNDEEKWQNKDVFFTNFLANDDIFQFIKPRYYCLSDPAFFLDNYPNRENTKALVKHLFDDTSWDMNIYVPYVYVKLAKWLEGNPHIKIVPFHTVECMGGKRFRHWMFSKGLANGQYGTVIQNCIYIAIHLRYSKIHLYGVDHNFFGNLELNENNVLCSRVTHFYDKGIQELKPLRLTMENMTVNEYLWFNSNLFGGYFALKEYSDYMNCEIINHTRNSLIDAFKKE
ncbi:MAG: hypothetical protein LUC91_01070 [Prevotella sp.]|nr:hypothetical protein [Prevotella sp.]